MTVVSDIANRLSDDAKFGESEFYSVVFDYGAGIVEMLRDAGAQPGTSAQVELEADLGSAEVYTEGQALPAPIESTYIKPAFGYKMFRAVIRESGHERRARGASDEGTRIADVERKVKRAMFAIRDLMAQTFDDDSTYGLEGMVDHSGNFGDASRTTYTKLKSYRATASSAAISTALLNQLYHASSDTPYGGNKDLWVTSATQARKIAELGSGKLAIPTAAQAGSLVVTDLSIGGAPVAILPNLANNIIIGLTGVNSGKWKFVWNEMNPGRFHVLDLGAANADNPMNLQISTSGAMYCVNPHEQAKLEALSVG